MEVVESCFVFEEEIHLLVTKKKKVGLFLFKFGLSKSYFLIY